MRAWLITVGEPLPMPGASSRPWRTGLLARELRARGHDVLWWTSSVDHFTKRYFVEGSARHRVEPGYALQFLHGRLYTKNVSLARLLNHREIGREFRRLSAQEPRPDVILCSYPTIELSDEAVRFGTAQDVPVLLDIRDLWPDEMVARLPRVMRPLAPLLMPGLYVRARHALQHATGITAISQTYLAWARRMGRRSETRNDLWAPLGYQARTPGTLVAREAADKFAQLGVRGDRKIVWFCGTFVGSIDLSTAIDSARLLADEEFQFVFTGAGERDAEWRALACNVDNVIFTGWATQDEISWLSSRSWAGLAAYKRDALMSLPNKLFEYMSAGLPVVSSLEGEARELIEGYDVGVRFAAGDAQGLATSLRELARDPQRRERMARNALSTFRRHFSADRVYRGLAEHLESCARASADSGRQRLAARGARSSP